MSKENTINSFNDSDWQRIQQIFEEALEKPEDCRAQFIQESAGDSKICQEVEELLAAFDGGEAELEKLPCGEASTLPLFDIETEDRPAELKGYRLVEEIHRGGQGVVYRAIQESTKRDVALKFIYSGLLGSAAVKKRFEREVELAGSLRHPGIVRIYDSGQVNEQCYYVMDYLEGDRLDEFVAQHQLTNQQVLELFIPICDAVNHAHQKGVIHRDLKPSNIIVDRQRHPHIVDFGLAKLNEPADEETLKVSFTGQILGTVSYMSPEQASGQPDAIDTRSDIYSLAVILYKLLTDRFPYPVGNSLTKDLVTIQTADPLPMEGVHREIETIVLKSLSKNPDRRYQTAKDFADDIRRSLRGEPIEAKRDSLVYLVRKTIQRHRVASILAIVLTLLVVTSTVVGWGLYLDADRAWKAESVAAQNYLRERDTARNLRDKSQRQRYFVEMDLAGRLLDHSGGFARVEEIVRNWQRQSDFSDELRCWEWYYLNSRIGRHLAELKLDEVPNCARFSPDGKWIAFGDDAGFVKICPTQDLSDLRLLGKHDNVVRAVSWSSDGNFLASGSVDHTVAVYDSRSTEQIATITHDDHVMSIEWHPESPILASSSNDGVVKVWQVNEGKLHSEFDIGTGAQSLDWSPDGKQLLVGTWGRQAKIWNLQQKKMSTSLPGFSGVLTSVRWNGAGKLVAVGEDNGDVSVRNVARKSEIWKIGTRRKIRDLTWSPDSESIAVVGKDRSIKIWSPFFPALLRSIEGHRNEIWSIDWSLDGDLLLSASHDSTLKIWPAYDPGDDRVLRIPGAAPVCSLAWNRESTRIAVGTDRAETLIFDGQSGKLNRSLDAGYGARLLTVAWSPDGRRVASGGWDETVVIWDAQSGEKITEFEHFSEKLDDGIPNIVNCVSWNKDGTKIASTCYDSSIFVWDPESGELLTQHGVDKGNIYWVDWHPNQPDLIAASTSIHGVWIWPLDHKQPDVVDTLRQQSRCVRWNPDGTRLAVCRDDGVITIHDTGTMNLQASLKNHRGQVFCVDWHPDGKRLATASEDGSVRIWDAVTATQAMSFERFDGPVNCLSWSTDGRTLAVGTQNGLVHIFDATSGYERSFPSQTATSRQ